MNFQGKRALITGGSSGIGLALATKLATAGADVLLMARDPVKLEAACKVIQSNCNKPDQSIRFIATDITCFNQVQSLILEHETNHGPFDLVINSAGVTQPGKFIELDLDVFRQMLEVNYYGTLHVLKSVLPGMITQKSGHVVNISSVAGFLGLYGYSAYGPSKFAIRGLSDSLRVELAEYNIGVSVVFPPDTQTPQLEYETPFKPPILVELDKSNKILSPEAVAESVLKGVSRRRYIITPGFDSSLYFQLTNFFGLVYPVMDLMIARARRMIRQ